MTWACDSKRTILHRGRYSNQMRRMPEVSPPLLKQDTQWIGKQPVASGNEHRLFCLCGEVSRFDCAKVQRYVVSVAVFRRGYGSADEVPLLEGHEGER